MNAIEWTAQSICRMRSQSRSVANEWTERIRSLVAMHGTVTSRMLQGMYKVNNDSARHHLRRQAAILGLRVVKVERVKGRGFAEQHWGRK